MSYEDWKSQNEGGFEVWKKNNQAVLDSPPDIYENLTDKTKVDETSKKVFGLSTELELPLHTIEYNFDEMTEVDDPDDIPVPEGVEEERPLEFRAVPEEKSILKSIFGYEGIAKPEFYWNMNPIKRAAFDTYMASRHILTRIGGKIATETGVANTKEVHDLYNDELINNPKWFQKSPELLGWTAEKAAEFYALTALFQVTGLTVVLGLAGTKLAQPFLTKEIARVGGVQVLKTLSKQGLKKVGKDALVAFLKFLPQNTAFLTTWSLAGAALKDEDKTEAAWSGALWGAGLSVLAPAVGVVGKVFIATKAGRSIQLAMNRAYTEMWRKFPRLMNAGRRPFSDEFLAESKKQFRQRFGVEPTAAETAKLKKITRLVGDEITKAAERDAALKAYWNSGAKKAQEAAKATAEAAKVAKKPAVKPTEAVTPKKGVKVPIKSEKGLEIAEELVVARGTRAAADIGGVQAVGAKNLKAANKILEKAGERPVSQSMEKITESFLEDLYSNKKPPVVGDSFTDSKGFRIEITAIKETPTGATAIDYQTFPKKGTGRTRTIYVDKVKIPPPKGEEPVPPQEPALGKEAGATTILPDVVTEATEVGKRLGATSSGVAKATKELVSKNVLRYTTHLKSLGGSGADIAKDFDEVTQRAQVRINNSTLDSKAIFKGVNKVNRENIAKATNKLRKYPEWIQQRAEKFRKVLDELLKEAQKLGVQRRVRGVKLDIAGTGKAFPQIPNADGERMLKLADTQGIASPEILFVAEEAVAAGKVSSIEQYVLQLKEFRKSQLRGVSGYLERTRVELAERFVEWDPDRILSGLFQKNWTFIEGARQWGIDDKGQSFPKLAVKSEKVRAAHGSDEAQQLERFTKAAFGQELLSSEAARNVSATIRGYQFLTKIAGSPLTILRNMLDRFNKVAAWAPFSVQVKTFIQYPPFINTFLKHSKQLEEEMIRSGAVFSNTAIAEGYQPGHLLTKLAGKAFASSELGNQVYIALAKRNAIEANLKILRQNPRIAAIFDRRIGKFLSPLEAIGKSPSQAATRLRELGNEELLAKLESVEDIDADLMNAVLHRTVRDNAFPVVLSTKRLWWDNHPFARVLTQFKIWGSEQIGHIWNDVIKDTVQNRDPAKMIRWLVTMATMGEIYNILRDFILAKDESLLKTLSDKDRRNAKDISITILKDLADGGAVGIVADLIYGIPNLIGGPSVQTLKNLGDTTAKIIWNPSQAKDAIKQFAVKDTPAARQAQSVLDKIDAQYNEKNLTQDYYKVRRQSFDWKFRKEHPKGTDKAKAKTIQALLGWAKNIPQERTLGYQMTTRAILVGDIEEASEHLFFLLKTAETPSEQESIERGIQSALNNASPLGKVAEQDLDEFFKSMSSEQQQTALSIQLKWNANVSDAVNKAITKWQEWNRDK